MYDQGLIKNYTAEGIIEKFRLVKFGAQDAHVARAGVGDKLLGTTTVQGASAAGKRVDVCLDRIRQVEYGGPVAFGDELTSDAAGRAIKAEPGAGVTLHTIGTAMSSGSLGTIGHVHTRPGTMTG